MSRATMLIAKEDGLFKSGYEYGNSWLGAAHIWNALFDAYVPKRFEFDTWLADEGKRVWALADDARLSSSEKIALRLTFDNYVVGRDEMATVADALDEFARLHPKPSHLPTWAARLRELMADATVRAAAFHHTSVTDNPWWEYGESEDEDGRPYNVLTGTRHRFVLAE